MSRPPLKPRHRHPGKHLIAGMALAAAALCLPGLAWAATITIINGDPAGVGFNDTTPRSPMGENPGDTLGEQRLFAFEYAADLFANKLESSVEILVSASFAPCPAPATAPRSAVPGRKFP